MPKISDFSSIYDVQSRVHITLTDDAGQTSSATETVTDEKTDYRVTLDPPSSFRPGRYRIQATLDRTHSISDRLSNFFKKITGQTTQGDLLLLDTYFDWGMVAMNPDSDAYASNADVSIGAALADDQGNPLCIETLTGSFLHGSKATLKSFCSGTGDTLTLSSPDAGIATLRIEAGSGTVAQEKITIDNHPLITVKRSSVSQTTAGTGAVMTINVTTLATITGTMKEHVPAGFTVSDVTPAPTNILKNVDGTLIEWDGQFQAATTRTFTYVYIAPQSMPLMGLFGPVQISGTQEGEAVSAVSSSEEPSDSSSETSSAQASSIVSASASASSESVSVSSLDSSASANSSENSSVSSSEVGNSSNVDTTVSSHSSSLDSSLASSSVSLFERPQSDTSSFESSSVSSGSSDSSESSASSESSNPNPSPSPSPISSFFTHLLASLTFGDQNTVSFTEDRRWEVLSLSGSTASANNQSRTLTLERKAAVFQADSAPTFKLIDMQLDANDSRLQDEDHHLKTDIAYEQLLQTIVATQDVKQAVAEHIVTQQAQTIATQAINNDTVRNAAVDAVVTSGNGDASVTNLTDTVAQAVATSDDAKQQLADLAQKNTIVAKTVDQLATNDTKDKVIAALAQQATAGSGTIASDSVDQAVNDAVQTQTSVTRQAAVAAVQTITQASATTQVVTQALEKTQASSLKPQDTNVTASTGASVLKLTLKGPNGEAIKNPHFHFAVGSVDLVLDPIPSFTPGLYTLSVDVTNPITGETQTLTQQFAWGVLAMNPDSDIYKEGDTAHIDFGALDDHGEIVCDASLTLHVTAPDNTQQTLTTDDGSIAKTGTCGLKQAGFIGPDFDANLTLNQEGTYNLTLIGNIDGKMREISSTIIVKSNAPFIITRSAATRLWPFADSPMDITVAFNENIDGQVVDTVPEGFVIKDASPANYKLQTTDSSGTLIIWKGSWKAGDVKTFHYDYKAPEISPHFYLIGPLLIQSDTAFSGATLTSSGQTLP